MSLVFYLMVTLFCFPQRCCITIIIITSFFYVFISSMLYVTGLLLSLRIYYRTYLSRVPKCIIRETNKNLYDSNDGLRSALASAAKRRVGRGRVGRVLADYFLTVIQFNEDSSIFNPLSSCLPRMKSPLAGCGPSDRAPWTTAGTSLRLRWTSRISGFNLRACCFLGAGQR